MQSVMDLICSSASAKSAAIAVYPTESYDIILSILKGFPSAQMSCLFMLRLMVLSSNTAAATEAQALLAFILESLSAGESAFSGVPAMVMALCVFANLVSTDSGDVICRVVHTRRHTNLILIEGLTPPRRRTNISS